MVSDIKKNLEEFGLGSIKLICTEWNKTPTDTNKTMAAAATVSAVMIASQKSCVDMAMYYIMSNTSSWCGVLKGNEKFKPYYALKTFSNLYKLGTEVEVLGDNEVVYALGAKSEDKEALIITNLGVDKDIRVDYENTGIFYSYKVYITDEDNDMALVESAGYPNPKGEIYIPSTKNSIVYIEFSREY